MEYERLMPYRNETITMMKAFAIILMVTAHSGFYRQGVAFINMFHIPLFFFCSGYCFKEKYLLDARTFVMKRLKGIYWPFVKWSLLFLALHNVFFFLNIYNGEYGFQGVTSELYTWQIFVRKAFCIVTQLTCNEQLLGGYWFLHTLFFASFIGYATIRIAKRKKLLVCVGILLIICLVMSVMQMKPS